MQVLVKRLPMGFALTRINRAPLILDKIKKEDRNEIILHSIRLIIEECKNRRWIMLQIAPEIDSQEDIESGLKDLGLKKLANTPWASGIVNLDQEEDIILASLNGKWRNCLRKGWKLGVKSNLFQGDPKEIDNLVKEYKKLQKEKDFIGLSSKLIQEMAIKEDQDWQFNIFVSSSQSDSTNQGTLVSIHHGKTAIYLIGSTTYEGRKNQCNYVLLWEAIKHARESGCKYFDIGGLDETTPKGIAHFKRGLNAKEYKIIGEWRGFFLPKLL
tara:strand:- start:251 stop:1060 length:810 start_codon:yes stop_codon:yes gene_type:complete